MQCFSIKQKNIRLSGVYYLHSLNSNTTFADLGNVVFSAQKINQALY